MFDAFGRLAFLNWFVSLGIVVLCACGVLRLPDVVQAVLIVGSVAQLIAAVAIDAG